MASPGREYSLDHHLLEHMKFSGIDRDNLNDLITIVVSLKNKYGIVPLAAATATPSRMPSRSATSSNPSRSTKSSTS
jgi:hypothetical protein